MMILFQHALRLACLLLLVSKNIGLSQTLEAEVDSVLNESFPPNRAGGVALISIDGENVFHKAYGLGNVELNVPMEPDMKFVIASVTKQFTAVAILMLMEQDKLSLEDEITKYIEDYPTHGHKITIHHLLTHTSGIRNHTRIKGVGKFAVKEFETLDFIRFFSNEPMDFAPGQKRNYSNSGYHILGYIIEKLSGQSYGDYIETRIFEPLGMKNSQFGSNEKIIYRRVPGYTGKADGEVNAGEFNFNIPFSSGALISTAGDLAKWNEALHSAKLAKKSTIELAFRNYKTDQGESTNYGYGFRLGRINDRDTIEHDGGIIGYVTYAVYFPKERMFAVIMSNCDRCYDIGGAMEGITRIALAYESSE